MPSSPCATASTSPSWCARTGAGLPDLLAAIEEALPWRDAEVSALVPYGRSDLIARAHQEGEVLVVAHGEEGTQLTARVPPDLAAQLAGAGPEPAVGANAAGAPRPAAGH